MSRSIWFPLLLLAIFTTGCANKNKEAPELTERNQYRQAAAAMESRNFSRAIEQLRELQVRFPFGDYAEQSQLDLIYAQFRSQDYPATVVAAQRFLRSYPNHPNEDYALYMRGLAHFHMERGLFDNVLSADRSARDLRSAREAFRDFDRLVRRYPDSEYAADARSRMVHIRNQLANQELHVARYYARRGAVIAAINRAQNVVVHYQQTPAVPEALAIMARGYKELGQHELAEKSLTLLQQNWPDSRFIDDGRTQLAWWPRGDGSILSLLTFDLL